jgi:hypothetical protein
MKTILIDERLFGIQFELHSQVLKVLADHEYTLIKSRELKFAEQ